MSGKKPTSGKKAAGNGKRKAGRPRIEFDLSQVEGFGQIGATAVEMSLRRKQIQLALAGNPTQLIWLGKQLLGQTDRQDLRHGAQEDVPLEFTLKIGDMDRPLLPPDDDDDDDDE